MPLVRYWDIRQYKKNLRERYRRIRAELPPESKMQKDESILQRLTALPEYKNCRTLLSYVSTPREVDTRKLITQALSDGKTVAVPYCVDGGREMEFYAIKSLEQLVPRTFGILEPVPGQCELINDFSRAICILPGFAFDMSGYRLGYGGGYYDRFLSGFLGVKIGVCYSECTLDALKRGRFDMPCDVLVTDLFIKRM